MSRTAHTDAEIAMLMFECGYCGAKTGEWCWRATGEVAIPLHLWRFSCMREVVELSGLHQRYGLVLRNYIALRAGIHDMERDYPALRPRLAALLTPIQPERNTA